MTWLIIGIITCVIFSAFFSSSEMSLSSSNRIRLENLEEEGDERAKTARKLIENYDDTLSTILVGNNLVNIAASSMASVLVLMLLGEEYAWASTLVLTLIVIIFGETIPKIVSKKNATRFSLGVAGFVQLLSWIFKPVTWVVVKLVELITLPMKGEEDDEDAAVEELHSIIETAEDEDVLDEDSSELVSAAIDFSEIPVSEVMTARVDVLAIDVDDDPEEIRRQIADSPYSRIPVYEDGIDNIIGVLLVNHYLKAALEDKNVDIRGLLMQPYFTYKTMKLPSVLEMLRDSQQHLAIVTDEYGGTLGLVTMEDVLEKLVGDIWDETDVVENSIQNVSEGIYEIEGDTPISELIDLMEWDYDSFEYESETVGGWCIEMLEEFPDVGASFEYEKCRFTVTETDERRVNKVRLEILQKDENNKEED